MRKDTIKLYAALFACVSLLSCGGKSSREQGCDKNLSDYLPYPYKEDSKETADYKVVRGGSFIERPKFSTSYSRKGFYPYQRVFNVGFRVIIEE